MLKFLKYKLKQEKNSSRSTVGKYKAVAYHDTTFDTEGIFQEIAERGPYDRGALTGVWGALSEAINDHLRQGHVVILKDLGRLKLEIESDSVDNPKDFKPKKHIRGVRLHIIPESSEGKPDLYKGLEFQEV